MMWAISGPTSQWFGWGNREEMETSNLEQACMVEPADPDSLILKTQPVAWRTLVLPSSHLVLGSGLSCLPYPSPASGCFRSSSLPSPCLDKAIHYLWPRSKPHAGQSVIGARQVASPAPTCAFSILPPLGFSSSSLTERPCALQGNKEVVIWANRKPNICWLLEKSLLAALSLYPLPAQHVTRPLLSICFICMGLGLV